MDLASHRPNILHKPSYNPRTGIVFRAPNDIGMTAVFPLQQFNCWGVCCSKSGPHLSIIVSNAY